MVKQDFVKATLTIKLKTVIANLKKEATFQNGHWSSSRYFEEDLKHQGVILPIEIYHKYNMPNGYTEKEYEDYIMWLVALIYFNPNRILDIPAYVNMITFGTDMSDKEKKDYQNKLHNTVKDLNETEKENLVDLLLHEKELAPQKILNQIKEIKTLNPELRDIKIDAGLENDFLIGVTSGFHPDDIKYFLSITDMEKARTENEQLRKKLGMDTYSLFMKPERMQKVIEAVQKQTNLNMLLNQKFKS